MGGAYILELSVVLARFVFMESVGIKRGGKGLQQLVMAYPSGQS
jgi:hypothetical protein